jgi:protein TonB
MQHLNPSALDSGPVTATDRLALTLFFAAVMHAMIILGITFGTHDDKPPENTLPTLDITVANRRTPPPEEAEYLAQTSQEGGGNIAEKVRPQQALPEMAPAQARPQQPVPAPTQVVTAEYSDTLITQDKTVVPEPDPEELSVSQLIERSLEMVNLSEQISESMQAYARRPRQIYVSARTREFKYANYMSEWVRKVERVGNLNYPDVARREGLSGKLLLDVALNPDGTVRNISVLRPSGHAAIDEAAIRIVNLAAPFPPFPADIRNEADVLHITRTQRPLCPILYPWVRLIHSAITFSSRCPRCPTPISTTPPPTSANITMKAPWAWSSTAPPTCTSARSWNTWVSRRLPVILPSSKSAWVARYRTTAASCCTSRWVTGRPRSR